MHDDYLIPTTADIVSAYLSANKVEAGALPDLIASVHASLSRLGQPVEAADGVEKLSAAAVRKSIRPDVLISFIDNKAYKTLRRHLTANGMTPDEYRAKFGLPDDYPMITKDYKAARSAMAHSIGLGRKRTPKPEPEPEPVEQAPAKRRGRAPKAKLEVA